MAKSAREFINYFPNACVEISVPDEVISRKLFIGSEFCLRNADNLRQLEISHILSICHLEPNSVKYEFISEHRGIPINDKSDVAISDYFDETFAFIESAEICLVNCSAGVSRSATICIAYLMRKNKISYEKARECLAEKSPQILPNEGFVEQLIAFERTLNL